MGKRARTDDGPALQYAALPWRTSASGLEVLLVSSRETRRWVIPKGWPVKKLDGPGSAAREAYEEAGVEGPVAPEPIGAFHYTKRMALGVELFCRVLVFPLEVAVQHETWPEKGEREAVWVTPAEAAERVDEPELRDLLRGFEPL